MAFFGTAKLSRHRFRHGRTIAAAEPLNTTDGDEAEAAPPELAPMDAAEYGKAVIPTGLGIVFLALVLWNAVKPEWIPLDLPRPSIPFAFGQLYLLLSNHFEITS